MPVWIERRPPDFPEPGYLDKESILWELNNSIQSYSEYIDTLIDYIIQLKNDLDAYDTKNSVEEKAFLLSVDFINDKARQVVMNLATQACIDTKEFNYGPYIRRLNNAISDNFHKIFQFYWDSPQASPFISLDFSSLGNVEEWAMAVEEVRKALEMGKTSPEWRSKFWAEKIYATGREGYRIIKHTKQEGSDEDTEEDITGRYAHLYDLTIQARLDLIDTDKAPFWYIIDNGNYQGVPEMGGDGEPYPAFPPTHFSNNSWEYLKELAVTTYQKFYEDAQEQYRYYFNHDYDLNVQDIYYAPDAVEELFNALADKPEYKEKFEKAEGQRTFYKEMTKDDIEVQSYKSSKGKPSSRVYKVNPATGKKKRLSKGQQ